jgi:SAM-dependent methyltransferase
MLRARTLIYVALPAALVCIAAAFAYHAYLSAATLRLAEETLKPQAGGEQCQRVPPSKLALKYLDELHGIEIGASTQNSFGLKRAMNVDFSDDQGGLWQQKSCPPTTVNIVASGDDLPFKDGTLDYVVSSHVIEHFFDPVKALKEWYRVIRPGGYVFIIAPHRDRTFDRHREVTPVDELLDRSAGRIRISDYARPLNQEALAARGMEKLGPFSEVLPQVLVRDKARTALGTGWAYYESNDHHHWSVWRTDDFVALVKRLNFRIVEVQDRDDKFGNGFTVVIRK